MPYARGRRSLRSPGTRPEEATISSLRGYVEPSEESIRNILANPAVCLVVDRYSADWAELGWVMLHGRARILDGGEEHRSAQAQLRDRYPQYRSMQLEELPVIAIDIKRGVQWGNLALAP